MSIILKTLKKIRKEQKLSQKQFGFLMGWPQSHLSAVEGERIDPRLSSVVQMARVLNHELIVVPTALLPTIEGLIHGEEADEEPLWKIR